MMSTNNSNSKTGSVASQQQEQQQLANKFNGFKNELSQIAQKIGELEGERDEHTLVLETMAEIKDPQRVCYRLVGGVLVKKTIGEVLPLVEQNKAGINSLMQNLGNTYKKKEEEKNAFQQLHNIKVQQG